MEGPNAHKDAPGYLRALHKAVEDTGARAIIPIFFPEVLARHRSSFEGLLIPIEQEDKILLLDNKRSACGLAASLGIPMPRIYSSADEVDSWPVVFRRCSGQGGDSVYFPRNRKALDNLLGTASDALTTEFIQGDDVSVDALRWDGFFFAAVYKVLEPKGKGVSTKRISIDAPELVGYARTMLDKLDYHGVCGMDFRMDAQGKPWFLECNPRFSGGLESALESGFDIPALLWELADGRKPAASDIRFTPGIITGNSNND